MSLSINSCWAQEISSSSIDFIIEQISFSENGQNLESLQSDHLNVYKAQEKSALTLQIKGRLFGEVQELNRLSAKVIPNGKQQSFSASEEDPSLFSTSLTENNLPFYEPLQLIIAAKGAEKDNEDGEEAQKVIEFILVPGSEYSSFFSLLWNAVKNNDQIPIITIILLITILFSLISRSKKWMNWKRLSDILVIALFLFGAYSLTTSTLIEYFKGGILKIPGQEQVIQTKTAQEKSKLTLTQLDENLEVIPSLSSYWSNINPLVWEFFLRPVVRNDQFSITAQEVVESLRDKIGTDSPERQYLNSIEHMVSINENRIQFITQFPDPLLALKLSKVNLNSILENKNIPSPTQLYLPLETYDDHIRSKRNENSFVKTFSTNIPYYVTEVFTSHRDTLRYHIQQGSIDIFDEPETAVWPYLFQSQYSIVPKVNTDSLVILFNHDNPLLNEENLVSAFRKVLQSPRILQTSYFQYGQLANQFAPPGVIGYHPKIEEKQDDRSISDLINALPISEDQAQLSFELHFPKSEQVVANIIEQELEKEGIEITLNEIATEEFDQKLLEDLPDLILMPLNFDLADIGPFLDTYIDSSSPSNRNYMNSEVDQLIQQSRSELNSFKRIELLQEIMQIIVVEDPAGIPLLFKRSFMAKKQQEEIGMIDRWLQRVVLGWE